MTINKCEYLDSVCKPGVLRATPQFRIRAPL